MQFKLDFQAIFGKAADQLFALALTHPDTFQGAARPILQGQSDGDIRKARALALEGLRTYLHVVQQHSERFLHRYSDTISYEELRIPLAGRWITPVGTACGVDTDADGLEPLSYLFGFQMPGPITLRATQGEPAPFQDDSRRNDLYVPVTLSSRGLDYALERLRQYRDAGGRAVILPALATGFHDPLDAGRATEELATMAASLRPYVDGFVWVPFGSADFTVGARVLCERAEDRLRLVEMPAYREDEREIWLDRVAAFLSAGGQGVVAVHGLEVPREKLPQPKTWPFETALWCGASMADYRQRAIEDVRRAFPSAFIIASGGFHHRDEAFRAIEYANAIAETEAFTRFGPGLAPVLLNKLALRLKFLHRQGQIDSVNLHAYQRQRWGKLAG
jgi:hypothetical protein